MVDGDGLGRSITRYTLGILLCTVLVTVVLGVGLGSLEESSSLEQFETDSAEAEKLETIHRTYGTDETNRTAAQVVIRGEDVLSKSGLLESLSLQRELIADERIEPTLVEDEPVADIASVIATAAIEQERAGAAVEDGEINESALPEPVEPDETAATGFVPDDYDASGASGPSVDDQIAQLEAMDESAVEALLDHLLTAEENRGLYAFLPTDHEPGATSSDARTLYVTQETTEPPVDGGEAPDRLVTSQLAMAEHVDERFGDDGFVLGAGIFADEIDRSLTDSLAIAIPLALLFVTAVLSIAYRDPLDIVTGLVGIVLVLLWTFGVMGWLGITFNQLMIAVPVLLIGLSIDYAIHVFMRHREARRRAEETADGSGESDTAPPRAAMGTVLTGVGAALVFVTAAAVIGFLSNLVSPIGPIREFGIASAVGIAAALVIFGLAVPAAKIELDERLEARGWDRRRRAFGTGRGPTRNALAAGATTARRVPWIVVVLALVLTAGGVVGATQLDTSFDQNDFMADEPPAWAASLPGPFGVGEYTAKENLAYANDRFLRTDARTHVLVEGHVAQNDIFEDLQVAHRSAGERESVVRLADGRAHVVSPYTVMNELAAENETVATAVEEADQTGDGLPDRNIRSVFEAMFDADEERAASVIHRDDDNRYESIRLTVSVRGDAGGKAVTEDTRAVAAVMDDSGRESTATGQAIVYYLIERDLLGTVVQSLAVSLVAMVGFLMGAYRVRHRSAILGALTLLPVGFGVAWILGTMSLLSIPFNVMTGTITSLTVGLGVAYNIHITERFMLERRRGQSVWDALETATTGTGGALLGSAATTVGGFGVLVFAILPPLQQFGLITGTTIVYAFLGSVFVLPCLLAIWVHSVGRGGPVVEDEPSVPESDEPAPATASTDTPENVERAPPVASPAAAPGTDPVGAGSVGEESPADESSVDRPYGREPVDDEPVDDESTASKRVRDESRAEDT